VLPHCTKLPLLLLLLCWRQLLLLSQQNCCTQLQLFRRYIQKPEPAAGAAKRHLL
jgi:hypothetical protein